ncbi:MAG TPA: ATPase, T2SS/T4P/T4SS family [Candidatus Paceibacterota bacterium]
MDILELLLQKGLLKKEQRDQVKREIGDSGEKPEMVLLQKGLITEDLLFQTKSEALGVELKEVVPDEVPLKVLELIPEDSARYYNMVPLLSRGGELEVGMVHPEDAKAQEALQFLARRGNFTYKLFLIRLSDFEGLMKQYRNLKQEMKRALEELQEEVGQDLGVQATTRTPRSEPLVEEAPVTKMVAVILRNAVEGGASDIHIEPEKKQVRVRFRFLGDLHSSLFLPSAISQSIVARIKILSNMKIDETRKPQDGRFSMVVSERAIDFRVATLPTPYGEKVAIRVLDPEAGLRTFEELGLEGVNVERLKKAAKRPFGLILVTGPTGSGKSTTLYSVLRFLNEEKVNIVSLEDPVEYYIDGVNQSQVRPELGYDFAQGLRQVLRQDPDIVMVGEVRDSETATLVIHAALTGHIVLSTLHTNNAVGVVARLVDMGVEKYLIPTTLSIAMAQRLVRRLCEDCKKKKVPEAGIRELLLSEIEQLPEKTRKQLPLREKGENLAIFVPQGCSKCGASGYSGRIAIIEAMEMSDAIAELILQGVSETKLQERAQQEGMTTMRQDGILKVLDGVTTIEEIIRVTADS